MKALHHRVLMLLAGLCCTASVPLFFSSVFSASLPQPVSSSNSMKRWVQFELNHPESMGDQQADKPVTLTIFLRGLAMRRAPVVAICESKVFYPQTVTLEPDASSLVWKGTVRLEPIPMSRTSVPPKAARVQVTFARSRSDKGERFLRRVVYVTLDQTGPMSETSELPPVQGETLPGEGVVVEEVQQAVTPVVPHVLLEEDLGSRAVSGEKKAYWQQVSQLINWSWVRHVRGVRHVPSGKTVRVRFKLYPNGRAQLIEVEKGSGEREIDEAGIYAVVQAQPFPSFSAELGAGPVDVHVRMRTGGQVVPLDMESLRSPLQGKSDAPGQPLKK